MEYLTASDGARLAFETSGRGPPLLFVHGAGAIHRTWDRVLPVFEEQFSCVALDRRGRGESEEGNAYSIERGIDDLVEIMRFTGPAIRIVAHSSGALLSLEAALRQEVRRMVLFEPPMVTAAAGYPSSAVTDMEDLIASGRREDAVMYFMRDVQGRPVEAVEAVRARPSWSAQTAQAHLLAAEFRYVSGYQPNLTALERLKTPTLFLYGSESRPLLRESTRALAATVPCGVLEALPGLNHDAIREAPEAFATAALGFLLEGQRLPG